MTRATRITFPAASLLLATCFAPLLPGQTAPNGQPPQPPQRASVYGPPVGATTQPAGQQPQQSRYQVQPVQAQQPVGQPQQSIGQAQPAGGQGPIRQPGLGNPGGPGLNVPRVQVVPPNVGPQQPEWFPLDPKVQEWVDQVLLYWEKRSDQVKTLECTFEKWEYDPQAVPDEYNRLKTLGKLHEMRYSKFARGVIKYAAPDKGLFRVTELYGLAPDEAGGDLKYAKQPPENGEHWVTDGKRVFAFDAVKKEVIESQLPPEMQGKSLADGPLPFMFGARAETIKARYWIRPLRADNPGEYCLEAVPKSRQDAANFKMVQIVLDEKEYLPVRMQIFDTDWSISNPHRTAFKFDNRVVNSPKVGPLLNPLGLPLPNPWAREFYEVTIPNNWKHTVVDASGKVIPPGGNTPANTATAPNAAGAVPR
jgi:TIGR03009 family protein